MWSKQGTLEKDLHAYFLNMNCRGTTWGGPKCMLFLVPSSGPRADHFCTGLELKGVATHGQPQLPRAETSNLQLQRPASKLHPRKCHQPTRLGASSFLRPGQDPLDLRRFCLSSLWALSGFCLGFVWTLFWLLSGHCLDPVWALSVLCLGSV